MNQQRSRDRKRQYTTDLEQKVKNLERELQEAKQSNHSHNPDSAVTQLSHENRVRGDLLCVLGIDRPTQERFIRTAPNISSQSDLPDKLAIESAPEGENFEDTALNQSFVSSPNLASLVTSTDIGPWTEAQDRASPTHGISFSPNMPATNNELLLPQSSSKLCTNCAPSSPENDAGDPSESTTACSIAFSMVLTNNKRGYEFIDLESRMRAGYQYGNVPGEECRVLNKVLFEVLAEIT